MTALLKYRIEELMQTSLSHRCQFLLFKLLFCLLFVVYCFEKKTLCSKALCLFFSWTASEIHYCATVLQAHTLGHMGSNDYSTTYLFVDNILLSTLSIMSTNLFSPSVCARWRDYFNCFFIPAQKWTETAYIGYITCHTVFFLLFICKLNQIY